MAALDDAAGVAGVLEQARAFAALPKRPRRSIVALLVTAEEKGLLGSDYFANHPTIPLQGIVADVNNDGPRGMWEPHDLIPLGAEHGTLMAQVKAATAALGLALSPDPQPEQVFFIRSDQYNFVRKGIPAVFPVVGLKDANGDSTENRRRDEWWTKEPLPPAERRVGCEARLRVDGEGSAGFVSSRSPSRSTVSARAGFRGTSFSACTAGTLQ